MGGTSCGAGAESYHERAVETVLWIDCSLHRLCPCEEEGRKGWMVGQDVLSLLSVLTALVCYQYTIKSIHLPPAKSFLPTTIICEQSPTSNMNQLLFLPPAYFHPLSSEEAE